MSESQSAVLALLEDQRLINEHLVIPAGTVDVVLDIRDSDEFSEQWMAAFDAVQSSKAEMTRSQTDLSTRIREAAYLLAYSRWHSPDLAAYVSDDFGLIADAAACGVNNAFVGELLSAYKRGVVPPCTHSGSRQ